MYILSYHCSADLKQFNISYNTNCKVAIQNSPISLFLIELLLWSKNIKILNETGCLLGLAGESDHIKN